MEIIKTSRTPIHTVSMISYPFGVEDSSYTLGYHTGLDFAKAGSDDKNPNIYSLVLGTVVYVYKDSQGSSPALGNQVMIKSKNKNEYYRFCHLESVNVAVGDLVTPLSKIGVMGSTGNSTGVHLHLEITPTMEWKDFINPAEVLGLPNEIGTLIYYEKSKNENTKKKYKTPFIFLKKLDIYL